MTYEEQIEAAADTLERLRDTRELLDTNVLWRLGIPDAVRDPLRASLLVAEAELVKLLYSRGQIERVAAIQRTQRLPRVRLQQSS